MRKLLEPCDLIFAICNRPLAKIGEITDLKPLEPLKPLEQKQPCNPVTL